jgi:hypothetical protein
VDRWCSLSVWAEDGPSRVCLRHQVNEPRSVPLSVEDIWKATCRLSEVHADFNGFESQAQLAGVLSCVYPSLCPSIRLLECLCFLLPVVRASVRMPVCAPA